MTAPVILLVEDDPALRTLTSRALQQNGFQVRPASSAPEMWRALDQGATDLVLLDITMPKLDGIAVIERIKILKLDTKVIVLTSLSSDYYAMRCIKAGWTP